LNIIWKDRVRQSVVSGGAGDIVLGNAAATCQALNANDENGLIFYLLMNKDGTWETGSGTYTDATKTFTRATIYDSTNNKLPIVTTTTTTFVLTENSGSFSYGGSTTVTNINVPPAVIVGAGTPVIADSTTGFAAKWIVAVETIDHLQARMFEVSALCRNGANPTFNVSGDIGNRIQLGISVVVLAGKLSLQLINNSSDHLAINVAKVQVL
jgi:hypothetical protein